MTLYRRHFYALTAISALAVVLTGCGGETGGAPSGVGAALVNLRVSANSFTVNSATNVDPEATDVLIPTENSKSMRITIKGAGADREDIVYYHDLYRPSTVAKADSGNGGYTVSQEYRGCEAGWSSSNPPVLATKTFDGHLTEVLPAFGSVGANGQRPCIDNAFEYRRQTDVRPIRTGQRTVIVEYYDASADEALTALGRQIPDASSPSVRAMRLRLTNSFVFDTKEVIREQPGTSPFNLTSGFAANNGENGLVSTNDITGKVSDIPLLAKSIVVRMRERSVGAAEPIYFEQVMDRGAAGFPADATEIESLRVWFANRQRRLTLNVFAYSDKGGRGVLLARTNPDEQAEGNLTGAVSFVPTTQAKPVEDDQGRLNKIVLQNTVLSITPRPLSVFASPSDYGPIATLAVYGAIDVNGDGVISANDPNGTPPELDLPEAALEARLFQKPVALGDDVVKSNEATGKETTLGFSGRGTIETDREFTITYKSEAKSRNGEATSKSQTAKIHVDVPRSGASVTFNVTGLPPAALSLRGMMEEDSSGSEAGKTYQHVAPAADANVTVSTIDLRGRAFKPTVRAFSGPEGSGLLLAQGTMANEKEKITPTGTSTSYTVPMDAYFLSEISAVFDGAKEHSSPESLNNFFGPIDVKRGGSVSLAVRAHMTNPTGVTVNPAGNATRPDGIFTFRKPAENGNEAEEALRAARTAAGSGSIELSQGLITIGNGASVTISVPGTAKDKAPRYAVIVVEHLRKTNEPDSDGLKKRKRFVTVKILPNQGTGVGVIN